jgi:hypothetical protein
VSTGTEACGQQVEDPRVVTNQPGLSTIADRVDDFAGFRRALLAPLEGEQALGAWAPAPGDLGLQVLEWWAYLADVLTFYNERIANESYLRTAKSPRRLADLVALIGYAPRPGVAASGQIAALRGSGHAGEPLSVPARMPVSSTASAGVPAQTFEVQAAADGQPWSFQGPSHVAAGLPPEEALALGPAGGPRSVLLAGRVSGVKAGEQLLLLARDWAGADDDWAWVTVEALAPAPDPATGAQNTLVTFTETAHFGPGVAYRFPGIRKIIVDEHTDLDKDVDVEHSEAPLAAGGLTSKARLDPRAAQGTAGGLRPRLSESTLHTGELQESIGETVEQLDSTLEEQTIWRVASTTDGVGESPRATSYRLLRATQAAALWTQGGGHDAIEAVPLSAHLSAVVRGLAPGEPVLLEAGASEQIAGLAGGRVSALGMVAGVSEQLWAVPYPPESTPPKEPHEIVVAHSVLDLTSHDGEVIEALDGSLASAGAVAVRYGFREVGRIVGVPATSLERLPALGVSVPSGWSVPAGGTSAFLQDAAGAGVLVKVVYAGPGAQAGLSEATLQASGATPAVLAPPLRVPLRLLLNLLPVTRGSTVAAETLGSGDASLPSQSFTLKRSPLTYLAQGSEVASTLAVYVDGIAWSETQSFYGQAPEAHVYTVSLDEAGHATVSFGDGVNGARLPSGSGNVVASYRYGSGAATPPAGRLTTIVKPQPNLASLANPVAVVPGADPQSPEEVRANAPASVFTFGRAISGVDYEIVAGQAPGVSRVSAVWGFDEATQRTAVTVYVGDDEGALTSAEAALAGAEDPNRPVSVLLATARPLALSCTLLVAADRQLEEVQALALAALCDPTAGLFSPAAQGIGVRLYRSQLDSALMVPGVLAVHELSVGAEGVPLADLLDPGAGAYFALAAEDASISVVSDG